MGFDEIRKLKRTGNKPNKNGQTSIEDQKEIMIDGLPYDCGSTADCASGHMDSFSQVLTLQSVRRCMGSS